MCFLRIFHWGPKGKSVDWHSKKKSYKKNGVSDPVHLDKNPFGSRNCERFANF